jgi:glycosyltransferase involved in cell wall biosynthesis
MVEPRFAIACPNYFPRTCGVGDQSLRLAIELNRRGFEAEIFTRGPASSHPEAPGVPVHGAEGPTPMVVAERIRRAITERRVSHLILQYVPHMWGSTRFGSAATVWLALAARQAGIDVTVVAHELYLSFSRRPDLLLGAALQRLQMVGVEGCAHRVLVTTDTRVKLVPFWRAASRLGRLGVMRIGPNATPISRVRAQGRCRLGIFTTMAISKRLDVVLAAFEHVWRERQDSELVIIGDLGSRDNPRTAALQEAVERHPARDRIRLTGKLPLADVARQIAELDVYLFPMDTGANTRSSTLPIALGCGVPVVAIRGSETDLDLFDNRESVLFAPALTGTAFGESALAILGDPQLAESLSDGGRRFYDQHLSWTVIVDAFLARLR